MTVFKVLMATCALTATFVLVVVAGIVGFSLRGWTAPQPIGAPNSNAIVLIETTYTALIKDTSKGPDAKWSDKPITIGSMCTGWVAQKSDDTVLIDTADHCVSEKGGIEAIKQKANPLAAIFAMLGGKADTNSIITKDPNSDNPVARTVKVTRAADVGSGQSVLSQVVDELPVDNGDQALLRVVGLEGPLSVLRLARSQGNVGDEVAATGFPGASGTDVNPRLTTTFGRITSTPKNTRPNNVPSITIDAPVAHGMSGGPVTNRAGQVIAFNDRGYDGDDARVYPAGLDVLSDFLGKHGIHPPTGGFLTLTWILR